MFENIVGSLLNNVAVQAAVAKIVVDVVKAMLKKVDDEHLVDKAKGWLTPSVAVLAAIVTAGHLALSGNLADLNVQAIVDYVMAYLGIRGAGTVMAQKAAVKVSEKIKGQ